jgi:hypothetical protein
MASRQELQNAFQVWRVRRVALAEIAALVPAAEPVAAKGRSQEYAGDRYRLVISRPPKEEDQGVSASVSVFLSFVPFQILNERCRKSRDKFHMVKRSARQNRANVVES